MVNRPEVPSLRFSNGRFCGGRGEFGGTGVRGGPPPSIFSVFLRRLFASRHRKIGVIIKDTEFLESSMIVEGGKVLVQSPHIPLGRAPWTRHRKSRPNRRPGHRRDLRSPKSPKPYSGSIGPLVFH